MTAIATVVSVVPGGFLVGSSVANAADGGWAPDGLTLIAPAANSNHNTLGEGPKLSADGLSADGRILMMIGMDGHIHVRNLATGSDTLADTTSDGVVGDQGSNDFPSADMSGDGHLVFFSSYATNLVPSPVSNLYLKNLSTGTLTNLPVSDGEESNDFDEPAISQNGRYLVFQAQGTDHLYLYDTDSDQQTLITSGQGGAPADGDEPQISNDGSRVVYLASAGSINGYGTVSVFLSDLDDGQTVDLDPPGCALGCNSYDPHLSADGRYVSYDTGNAPGGMRHRASGP
jgi:Tol biopolymer transport system component